MKNGGKYNDKINLSKLRELRESSNNVQEFKIYLKLSINYNLQLDSQVIWKLQVNKFEKRVKYLRDKSEKVIHAKLTRKSKKKVVKRGIQSYEKRRKNGKWDNFEKLIKKNPNWTEI